MRLIQQAAFQHGMAQKGGKQIPAVQRQPGQLRPIQQKARGRVLGQKAQPGRRDLYAEKADKGLPRGRAGGEKAQLPQAAMVKFAEAGQMFGAVPDGSARRDGLTGKHVPALGAFGQQDAPTGPHQQADLAMDKPLFPHKGRGQTAQRTIAGIDHFQQGMCART